MSGFLAAAGKGVGLGFAAAGRSVPKAMTSSMMAASTNSKGGGVQLTFKKAMGLSSGGSAPHIISATSAPSSSSSSGPLIATGGVIPGNTAANPYIEGQGMGRGKHLTKPSWSINGDQKETSLGSVSESAFSTSTSARISEAPSSSATKLNLDPDQFQDVPQSGISKGSDGLVAPKRSRFSASTNPLEVIPTIGLYPFSHIESSTALMSSGHQVTVDDLGDSNNHLSNSSSTASAASTKRSRWDK